MIPNKSKFALRNILFMKINFIYFTNTWFNMVRVFIVLISFSYLTAYSAYAGKTESEIGDHNGFQASLFMGPAFGDVNGSTGMYGNMRFKGACTHAQIHLGWAFNNWAAGFSSGINTTAVESVVVQNNTYSVVEDLSIDGGLTGIYIKRYFMPMNVFVSADLGVGTWVVTGAGNTASTERGFAWNLSVGKEFQLGSRKRFGIGGYFNVSGLKCNDMPPYQADSYRAVLPGLGLVLSWH